jgi:hypothetical protein
MAKKLTIRFWVTVLALIATFAPLASALASSQGRWGLGQTFVVSSDQLPVYQEPEIGSKPGPSLYKGMTFVPSAEEDRDGVQWFKVGTRSLWVPAEESGGIVNVAAEGAEAVAPKIVDLYGILDQPHRYAAKLVKLPDAKGRLETYEKTADGYKLRHTYDLTYRKDGPKEKYGDLKSPGGPVIRYLYRTTNSAMDGRDKEGQSFGVYKVSYPMPHDALPYLLSGKMTLAQYADIPAINRVNGKLYPQPQGMLGADILIHTVRWGSLGCFNIENEAMSSLYLEDLVTENDQEIIPLVIYDENVVAPPEGQLF